jgi:hypothetical protein
MGRLGDTELSGTEWFYLVTIAIAVMALVVWLLWKLATKLRRAARTVQRTLEATPQVPAARVHRDKDPPPYP